LDARVSLSAVGSIFFFGYLAAEFPGSALVQKLPVGKVAATLAISWGSATMILGACQNAGGLLAVRFIQGMFEAPIVPALSIMTVMWWTKKEQPVRVAMWYSGFSSVGKRSSNPPQPSSPLTWPSYPLGEADTDKPQLFTGIISYGVGHSHSAVASWRLLFIVLGGFTFLWGLFILAFLPDTPLTARFLNEKEKFIALHRIKGNKTGVENKVRLPFEPWRPSPAS
jgi:MFS family permease